jgi:NAD(P)-dependent dehydrogenase (short-subunit alcohol dehydrogenase family)
MTKMNQARVVVVGGSSGIGLGVAEAALAAGATEVVIAGRSTERLAAAERALGAHGPGRVRAIPLDVTDEKQIRTFFETVGPFDHLAITAAETRYQALTAFDEGAARTVIESKLLGPVLLAKHAAARIRPGGSITLTAGVASERPLPKGALVAAVNGGLMALGRALALELAPIRVNVVSPGWVDTPVWDRLVGTAVGGKEAAFAAMAARLPVGRIGSPADIAEAFLFLMQNGFTTGTTLHVDGGHQLV